MNRPLRRSSMSTHRMVRCLSSSRRVRRGRAGTSGRRAYGPPLLWVIVAIELHSYYGEWSAIIVIIFTHCQWVKMFILLLVSFRSMNLLHFKLKNNLISWWSCHNSLNHILDDHDIIMISSGRSSPVSSGPSLDTSRSRNVTLRSGTGRLYSRGYAPGPGVFQGFFRISRPRSRNVTLRSGTGARAWRYHNDIMIV